MKYAGKSLSAANRLVSGLCSLEKMGSPNQSGPIITGGGLIFIGASIDNRFRAY